MPHTWPCALSVSHAVETEHVAKKHKFYFSLVSRWNLQARLHKKQLWSGKIFHIFNLIQNLIICRHFHTDYIIIMNTCLHESASFIPQLEMCVRGCMRSWMESVGTNAQICAYSWAHATPNACVPWATCHSKKLPKASAVSPVTCCPLTSADLWGCSSPPVKDSALFWLIMMLRLSLICLTFRSAIWHLHGISIYLWASHLTLQCTELVGMTPVRQRRRCHSGRVTQWRIDVRGKLRLGDRC